MQQKKPWKQQRKHESKLFKETALLEVNRKEATISVMLFKPYKAFLVRCYV